MKELADILHAHEQVKITGGDAALATVVRVDGSAYRREGARMLITGEGHIVGGVSGGCLDRDVVQRAGGVIASGLPVLVRYDTALDPENGAGYTLGCGGAVHVLIESLNTPAGAQLMAWLAASRLTPQVVATVISKHSSIARLGQRLRLDVNGQMEGSIGDQHLCAIIAGHAAIALQSARFQQSTYPCADGEVDVLLEHLNPPLQLLIFGAGNDAVPLAAMGRTLGWKITVVDVRSSPPDIGRGWDVDVMIRCRVDEIADRVATSSNTAAVVMTHNFAHDRKVISWLMHQPLMYLGLLGARHRTRQLLSDLAQQLTGLHSPVGLDLGAGTPEEVALSIAAEITAVLHGRTGISLTQLPGSIHNGAELSRQLLHPSSAQGRQSISCPIAAS